MRTMIARMVSTIASRRSERPGMVTALGYAFCIVPPIVMMVVTIAAFVSSPDANADRVRHGLEMLGSAALFGGLVFLLGYGLLTLKRAAYWGLLILWALGSAVYLVDDLQAGKFPWTPVLNLVWFVYLLQPSVRRSFHY